MLKMRRYDIIAVVLSLLAVIISAYISIHIFEELPHIEDEITYVWQARLAAEGKIAVESPVCPKCFLEPFVVDYQGLRFGKYPPGWPALLAVGIRLGIRSLVNPLLAGLFVWFNYLLVKKLTDAATGIVASILTITSPFFLMNSGSLLAHPWSLLLGVFFTHAWLDTLAPKKNLPRWVTITTACLSMGLLILNRPLTAVGFVLPFIIHGLIILVRGPAEARKNILWMGAGCLVVALLYPLWQFAVTGSLFTNPYVLYWPYDKIGFGPGVGLHPDGHQLKYAWTNTRFSLQVGFSDLFGWLKSSWLFLPFGLLGLRKNRSALLVSSVFFSLVLVYGLYWIGSWVFGPRYYYEGLSSLTLLSAAGIRWLAGRGANKMKEQPKKPAHSWQSRRIFNTTRFIGVYVLAAVLIICNLVFYLPQRLGGMKGLYGVSRQQLLPFMSSDARQFTPALVIVDPAEYWLEYGALLDLSSPLLDTPFIFTYNRGRELNAKVIRAYPERNLIYYYTDQPTTFYLVQPAE